MNTKAIALVIVALFAGGIMLGAFFVAPTLAASKDTTAMTITFYNANGTAVYQSSSKGTIPFAITNNQGAVVTKAIIVISYSITSGDPNKALTSQKASGNLFISQCAGTVDPSTVTPDKTIPLAQKTGATSGNSPWQYTLDLTTYLSDQGSQSSIDNGWKVSFQVHIDGQATWNSNVLTNSWDSSLATYQLYWQASQNTITVDGTVGISLSP